MNSISSFMNNQPFNQQKIRIMARLYWHVSWMELKNKAGTLIPSCAPIEQLTSPRAVCRKSLHDESGGKSTRDWVRNHQLCFGKPHTAEKGEPHVYQSTAGCTEKTHLRVLVIEWTQLQTCTLQDTSTHLNPPAAKVCGNGMFTTTVVSRSVLETREEYHTTNEQSYNDIHSHNPLQSRVSFWNNNETSFSAQFQTFTRTIQPSKLTSPTSASSWDLYRADCASVFKVASQVNQPRSRHSCQSTREGRKEPVSRWVLQRHHLMRDLLEDASATRRFSFQQTCTKYRWTHCLQWNAWFHV